MNDVIENQTLKLIQQNDPLFSYKKKSERKESTPRSQSFLHKHYGSNGTPATRVANNNPKTK